ncbi:MAG: outer membrane beta-barrel protein [Saprospiraceae bacterium]
MEKDNKHIASEFVDHSWQEMSKLLDQEMPVKKRKRRFFWLFFFGIGLLGLISLVYYTTGATIDKEPPLKSFAIQKEDKVAATKTQLNKNSPSPINSKKGSVKQALAKSSDDIREISISTAITKIHPTAAKIATAVGAGSRIKNSQSSIQSKDKKESLSTKKEIKAANRFDKELPIIATLSLSTLPYDNNQLLSLPLTAPNIKKKSSKWRFGLYAATLAPKMGSFRTGLFTEVELNKKWAIHFGLGYARRIPSSKTANDKSLNAPFADTMEIEELEDISPTAGASSADTTINTNTNTMDLIPISAFNYRSFHYFELPILFQYKVRSKISLELGGSIGYLYGYRYQSEEASIFTTNSNPLNNSLSGTRVANFNQAAIGTINRINLTFISGLNYQLSKNIVGYTNYQLSNKYLKYTKPANIPADGFNLSQRWQQIEVGIRYYFK